MAQTVETKTIEAGVNPSNAKGSAVGDFGINAGIPGLISVQGLAAQDFTRRLMSDLGMTDGAKAQKDLMEQNLLHFENAAVTLRDNLDLQLQFGTDSASVNTLAAISKGWAAKKDLESRIVNDRLIGALKKKQTSRANGFYGPQGGGSNANANLESS